MTFIKLVESFPFFTIIAGLVTALLCLFLHGKSARIALLSGLGLSALLNLGALILTAAENKSFLYRLGPENASLAAINQLRFSPIECLAALAFSLVLFLSILGGYRYVRQDIEESKQNLYYILVSLLSSAMMALTYTNDLFTGYVFLEILTLTSTGILMIRELGRTTVAAVRYMLVNLLGSGLFLMGVIVLYGQTGNLLMESIRETLDRTGTMPLPVYTAAALICGGLAIKSGLFPFHFWMPDTYGFATPASSSVLSGVVSKGYILLLIKVLVRVIGLGNPVTVRVGWLLLVLGVCGILFGSVAAIRQDKLNKMLAFSSAAQIGYIYAGIGIGCICGEGAAAVYGFTAAIYHIFSHAATKPLLFLTSARLSEVSGNSSVFKKLRSSGRKARLAAVGFTAGALSMVGVPLFSGFVSKVLFSVAVIRSEKLPLMLTVLIALAVSTLLNALYFLRTVITVYTAENPEETSDKEEPSRPAHTLRTEKSLLFSSAVFTALNLFLGCASGVIINLLVSAFESGLMG